MTTSNAANERWSWEKSQAKIKDLEERLANSQKAVRELVETRLTEMEDARSRRVLEEREACARVVENVMAGIGETGTDNPLGLAAEMIRKRR